MQAASNERAGAQKGNAFLGVSQRTLLLPRTCNGQEKQRSWLIFGYSRGPAQSSTGGLSETQRACVFAKRNAIDLSNFPFSLRESRGSRYVPIAGQSNSITNSLATRQNKSAARKMEIGEYAHNVFWHIRL
ncbi:hypothetical protein DL89DRAFT_266720 [Linderina pennispora]|uniref:Uncharacterized protein n=1 Tax=Linderina pennispora TaxID=61395 RepID=A0A1Y1WAE0_9FUNG|nr:uncharacterized protein DL89DRAFT_266720 [Linderina pennispora]ORX70509.1 hypothetical protein DL89DRAFT_266720 [Linderina pennispora]